MKNNTNFSESTIFNIRFKEHSAKTDKLLAKVLVFEWFLGIFLAIWVTPQTWIGNESQIHIHVYAAVFLGALISFFPVYRIKKCPGEYSNRFLVAISQMIYSILYIHLTGGRIETHFHIFGSLAFLAFYRDYRPVVLATVITSADHLLRGAFYSQSIYGVLSADVWRALEHSAWVIFEDIVLFVSIKYARDEMHLIASQQNQLETTVSEIEIQIAERAEEMMNLQQKLTEQQQVLASSSKMSALGEMAGGVAHEINTPLAVIQMRTDQIMECMADKSLDDETLENCMKAIDQTVKRISKIVNGLRSFARDGKKDPFEMYFVSKIVEDTFSLCREKFNNHGVLLEYQAVGDVEISCRPGELSQVLLNLLNNSYDAIQTYSEKWVRVETAIQIDRISISVTDCGPGIPPDIQKKLMQPFFTTKEIGKGTGLGLSISRGIVEAHSGKIWIDSNCVNTRFVVELPVHQTFSEDDGGKTV